MDIPHEKQFHFHDGSSASSIADLKTRIEAISYQEFYTHVNNGKNDFANWVQYVFHEEPLAENLRKVTSIVETVEVLSDFLHPHTLALPDHTHDQNRDQEMQHDMHSKQHEMHNMQHHDSDQHHEPHKPYHSLFDDRPKEEMMKDAVMERKDEDMTVETVPTIQPALAETRSGFTVVEEETQALANPKIRDELFHSAAQQSSPRESQPSQPIKESSSPMNSDIARMIVKDFMYGFIFGLIIGVILGRILTF